MNKKPVWKDFSNLLSDLKVSTNRLDIVVHSRGTADSHVGVRGGGTPYNGLYGEAPPERGTFFRLQVYKRVGISQV